MKIKLDKDGALHIERAGIMNMQYCLHSPHVSRCGHWCPAFGEPVKHHDQFDDLHLIELRLCREAGCLSIAEQDFTDERGHDNDQT